MTPEPMSDQYLADIRDWLSRGHGLTLEEGRAMLAEVDRLRAKPGEVEALRFDLQILRDECDRLRAQRASAEALLPELPHDHMTIEYDAIGLRVDGDCPARHPETGNACIEVGEHETHLAMGTQRPQRFGDHLKAQDD